jgi:hypothetical protein
MERPKRAYSIYGRPTIKANRSICYARFRDANGKYMSAISMGCSRRDDALRWCEQRLKDSHQKNRCLTLKEYAEGFWDSQGTYAQSWRVRGYSVSPGTLYVAGLTMKKHLLAEWGSATLSEITPAKLYSWIIALKKKACLPRQRSIM